MTVSTTTSRIAYTGAGTTGPFAIPFKFLANADIIAIRRTIADGTEVTLALTTDYTLTGAGAGSGGELTLVASLSSAYELIIINDPDITQGLDLQPNDPLPSDSIDDALDRLTIICQRIADRASRSIQISEGLTSPPSLVLPAAVAEGYWRWNASASAVEFVPITLMDTGTLVVSAFAETILDDANGPAVKKTLSAGLAIVTTASQNFALADCGKSFVFTSVANHVFNAASVLGNGWYIDVSNQGTATAVFDPDGTETIDGVTTLLLLVGESCRIVCDGSNFYTIGLPATRTIANIGTAAQIISAFTGNLFAVAIPANIMRTNKQLEVEAWGDFLNNTGLSDTLTLRLGFATQNYMDTSAVSYATNASRRTWRLRCVIKAADSTAAQISSAVMQMSAPGTLNSVMSSATGDFITSSGSNNGTVNTTAAQTLTLSAVLGSSSAQLAVRLNGANIRVT